MIAPVDINDIPEKQSYISQAKEDVLRFCRSGEKAGKVVLGDKNIYQADTAYRNAITALNLPLRQMIRNKELYIIRTNV